MLVPSVRRRRPGDTLTPSWVCATLAIPPLAGLPPCALFRRHHARDDFFGRFQVGVPAQSRPWAEGAACSARVQQVVASHGDVAGACSVCPVSVGGRTHGPPPTQARACHADDPGYASRKAARGAGVPAPVPSTHPSCTACLSFGLHMQGPCPVRSHRSCHNKLNAHVPSDGRRPEHPHLHI